VLGGFWQSTGDPNPSPDQQGIFDLAIDEYRTGGRDVYMYDYTAVDTNGQGIAYDAVVSAINERGVTDVAIMGYSWGGGATFDLANRMEMNRRAELVSQTLQAHSPFHSPDISTR
jgi:dienelactone hydrolase